jgi:hypothetical protein
MNMSRLIPYLGIIAALAIGILIAAFSGSVTVLRTPTIVIPVATSTTISTTATSTRATSIPKKVTSSSINTASATPVPVPVPLLEDVSFEAASALRLALVNIICYVPVGSVLHSILGSGVFVDPKGIILTNAHVAQYFLLADRDVSCTIRSGSPAIDQYDAALAYISPEWLRANPSVLTETSPTGTGEYDFAFLAISNSATTSALPSLFPYLLLATTPPIASTPIVIASYGAQFLESKQIKDSLFPTIVRGSVKDIFTFGTNTIDVLALGGSAAAQEGSSGGGIIDASGAIVGTITTSTITGATDTRSLDAITASYIRAEYASETGQPLEFLLDKSPANAIADFAPQIPSLESIITANLP